MKNILVILFLVIPLSAFAQNDNMQNMMQALQKMQQCMENIDQTQLQKIESESEKINNEIQTLCQQGKRNEAQAKAIKFSKQVMKDPVMKQMQQCSKMMAGVIPPEMQKPSFSEDFFEDFDDFKNHVCDNE